MTAGAAPSSEPDPAFYLLTNYDGQNYHLISVESLAALSPENPALAARVMQGLGGLGLVGYYTDELERDRIFALDSILAKKEAASKGQTFLIAERIGELMDDTVPPFMQEAPQFGEKKLALLERANQRVMASGIEPRRLPVEDYSDEPIELLELPARIDHLLKQRAIYDIRGLLDRSEESLLWIRGFSRTHLKKVKLALFKYGFKLAATESPEDSETVGNPVPLPDTAV